MTRCAVISESEIGSVELAYIEHELFCYLWSEEPERINRTPLVRALLSDSRLRHTKGFLPSGDMSWMDREDFLQKASVGRAEIEEELNGRS